MTTLETLRQSLHEHPLPAGWRMVRLGEQIAEVQAGFASGVRDSDGVIQLRMNNVDTRGNLVWDEVLRVPANAATIDHYRLIPGDVMFNNTNSTELVGKSALFEGYDEPVVFSNHFTRIRPKPGVLLPEFLAAWLNQQWIRGVFANICNRWVGQSAVKGDRLLKMEFPLPPVPEQKRITAILREQMATVEKARAAAQARLEASMALRGSMLRSMFAGERAAKWQRVPIANIADIVSGIQKSPNRRPVHFHRPFLTVRNVQRGSLDLAVVERFEVTPVELDRLRLCLGDILIVEGNGSVDQIGRNAIFDVDGDEWIHQNHIIRVRLNPSTTSYRFISHFLNSQPGKAQMVEKAQTTSGLYTLSSGKVGALEVPHPPIAKQREVVEVIDKRLDAFNTITSATADEMAAIDALPAAILRRAFAGDL
ncbi:MAG: restriction endonuclease subunit S [Phycisphaeraceae bacterium]|nr:restriction endonuclease subunit S [Phycisphaeraceae bacterium]